MKSDTIKPTPDQLAILVAEKAAIERRIKEIEAALVRTIPCAVVRKKVRLDASGRVVLENGEATQTR